MVLLIGGCLDPALGLYRDTIDGQDKAVLTQLINYLKENKIGFYIVCSPGALPENGLECKLVSGTPGENFDTFARDLSSPVPRCEFVVCLSSVSLEAWQKFEALNAIPKYILFNSEYAHLPNHKLLNESEIKPELIIQRRIDDPLFFNAIRRLEPDGFRSESKGFGLEEIVNQITPHIDPKKQVSRISSLRRECNTEILDAAIKAIYGSYLNFPKFYSIVVPEPEGRSRNYDPVAVWHSFSPARKTVISRYQLQYENRQRMEAQDFGEPHAIRHIRYLHLDRGFKICLHFHSNENYLLTPIILPFYGDTSNVSTNIKRDFLDPARISFKSNRCVEIFEAGHGYYVLAPDVPSLVKYIETQYQPAMTNSNPNIPSKWAGPRELEQYWKFMGSEFCDILFYKPNTNLLVQYGIRTRVSMPNSYVLNGFGKGFDTTPYTDHHLAGRKYDKIILFSSYSGLPLTCKGDLDLFETLASMLKKNGKIFFDAPLYINKKWATFTSGRFPTWTPVSDGITELSETTFSSHEMGGIRLQVLGEEHLLSPYHPFTDSIKLRLNSLGFSPRVRIEHTKNLSYKNTWLYCIIKER